MQFSIDRNVLIGALTHVVPVAAATTQIPVLSHVKLDVTDDGLTIEANNLETAIRVSSQCETVMPGATCAPARRLLDVVKSCPSGPIAFAMGDAGRLRISAGSASFSVSCLDSADWPVMGVLPDGTQEGVHDPKALATAIDDVAFAASIDESRFNLSAVHIGPTDIGIRLTATDGHRLARCEIPGLIEFPDDRQFALLPRSATSHLVKLLRSASCLVNVAISDKNLTVSTPGVSASFRLLDGEYPDVSRVIPGGMDIAIPVEKQPLIDAVGRANIFTNDRNVGVDVEIGEGTIKFSAQNADTGEGSDSVPVTYDGEPFTLIVNGAYFVEALRHIGSGAVNLVFPLPYTAGSPFLLKPENMSVCKAGDTPVDTSNGVAYFSLVMPMRKGDA